MMKKILMQQKVIETYSTPIIEYSDKFSPVWYAHSVEYYNIKCGHLNRNIIDQFTYIIPQSF